MTAPSRPASAVHPARTVALPADGPLAGKRLVLALDRRAAELAAALERRGAEVQHAPAMQMLPHVDDPELLARTAALIARPPHLLIATTGVGMRAWFEAARAAGLGHALRAALADTHLIARGAKARGAAQQLGLSVAWVAETGTSAEVIAHLAGRDLRGLRAAVQHHGSGADDLDRSLSAAGAAVTALTVYRWGPPRDPAAVQRSALDAAAGSVHGVLFTAAPGTENWLAAAEQAGALPGISDRAWRGELLLAAVGPLTAAPLTARRLPALMPARSRMGALVKAVTGHFAQAAPPLPETAADPRPSAPTDPTGQEAS